MDKRYKEIQARYLAEMRTILPAVMAWWKAHAVRDPSELVGSVPQNDFEARWPAGPTAHPRVLHVFRKYFLEIDTLNLDNESREPPRRRDKGKRLGDGWRDRGGRFPASD